MSRLFLYRCPVTGYQVQGSVAVADPPPAERRLVGIDCAACGRIHIVDPVTGKLASERRASARARKVSPLPAASLAAIDPQK